MSDITNKVEFELSRRGYYADFFLVPVATSIAAIWLFTNHAVPLEVFTSSILVGVIAWTFAEYAIHRWVFHGKSLFMRKQHAFHHMRPHDLIGATSIFTSIFGAVAFWGFTATFGAVIGVGLLVGFVSGYLAYITVHDRFHHSESIKPGSTLAKLNRNHDFHHRRFRMNYGVTSPFWDIVFGTYQRPTR